MIESIQSPLDDFTTDGDDDLDWLRLRDGSHVRN